MNDDWLYGLARDLAGIFDEFGVKHFLIGGFAVKKYDDYRLTYDVDLEVAPVRVELGFDRGVAKELADRLRGWAESRGFGISTKKYGERLPVSQVTKEIVENVLRSGNGRTLEFWREGKKFVDVIVGGVAPAKFYEDVYNVIDGMNVAVPEYLVVGKLRLVKEGKAEERDRRDVLRLLAHVELDKERLERYAKELGVSALLREFARKVDEARSRIRDVHEG